MGSFPWTDEKNKRCPHRLSKIPAPLTIVAENTVLQSLTVGFGKAKLNLHNTICTNIFHTCLAHIFTVPETIIFSKMSTAAAQWRQTWPGRKHTQTAKSGEERLYHAFKQNEETASIQVFTVVTEFISLKTQRLLTHCIVEFACEEQRHPRKKRLVICLHSSCFDSCQCPIISSQFIFILLEEI